MRSFIRRRRPLTFLLVVLTLIGAGCGDDGAETTTDDPTETTGGDDTSTSSSASTSASTSTGGTDGSSSATTTDRTSTTGAGDGGTTSTERSSTTGTPSTAGGKPGDPTLVDVRAVPIVRLESQGQTTLELTVEGSPDPCFVIDRVERTESDDEVELTVHAGSEPGAICIQVIEEHRVVVELDAPLGSRTIIDGATGQRR